MKQFLKQLFNKKQKSKTMVGKKVKLVSAPSGKASSSNANIGKQHDEYTVMSPSGQSNSWNIVDQFGNAQGWVYEWEMEVFKFGIKELEKELSEAQTKLNNIQFKIDWMTETGSDEFSEDEFKVYQTLKLLEDEKLSRLEKSKLIAELIKK
jgi:alpha-amylase/alpha-mannosidase (GH57 family)